MTPCFTTKEEKEHREGKKGEEEKEEKKEDGRRAEKGAAPNLVH